MIRTLILFFIIKLSNLQISTSISCISDLRGKTSSLSENIFSNTQNSIKMQLIKGVAMRITTQNASIYVFCINKSFSLQDLN